MIWHLILIEPGYEMPMRYKNLQNSGLIEVGNRKYIAFNITSECGAGQ